MYDYKQQKWVPYVSDPDKGYQHLLDVRDGFDQPDHLGRYIVGSGDKYRKMKDMEDQKHVVNLVSHVAQAMEMARSEIKRERKKEEGRKKVEIPPRKKSRRRTPRGQI